MNETIVLIDEENVEHVFEVEAFLTVEEKKYAVLIPQNDDNDDEEEEEVVILRLDVDAEGEEILVDIEDDEEWERVADAYDAFAEEEYGK